MLTSASRARSDSDEHHVNVRMESAIGRLFTGARRVLVKSWPTRMTRTRGCCRAMVVQGSHATTS